MTRERDTSLLSLHFKWRSGLIFSGGVRRFILCILRHSRYLRIAHAMGTYRYVSQFTQSATLDWSAGANTVRTDGD